ncbi:MAG: hypothetical protein ACREDR_46025, partial [Blastocatellia bacterium]
CANPCTNEPASRSRSRESGYAYLMALFMVVVVIIASTVVLQNLAIQGKRLREQEMIWRGNQYVRAIRLYYHKTGKYPQSLDDLGKGMPELHFLRQEYKDPMNKEDGAWRLIYVNAAGQIIGSVRYASLQQMALLDGAMQGMGAQPGQAAGQPGVAASSLASPGLPVTGSGQAGPLPQSPPYAPAGADDNESQGVPQQSAEQSDQSDQSTFPSGSQAGGQPGSQSSDQLAQSSPGNQNSTTNGQFAQPGQLSQPGQLGDVPGAAGQNPLLAANAAILQQKPTGPVDGPVIGAFLTGVASKVDQPSIKWLNGGKAKKYKDWEFIWNPLEDQAQAMQQGLNGGGQSGQTLGGFPIANPNPGG